MYYAMIQGCYMNTKTKLPLVYEMVFQFPSQYEFNKAEQAHFKSLEKDFTENVVDDEFELCDELVCCQYNIPVSYVQEFIVAE